MESDWSCERLAVECVKNPVKIRGGSVRYGSDAAACCGPLGHLQDIVNAEVYKYFFNSMSFRMSDLHHVNASFHTSKKVNSFLVGIRVQVMDWPAQRHNLNPI